MEIWGTSYRPFALGGDVHQPVKCDVPVEGPYELGLGYEGFLVNTTDDRTFVVEAASGGIVGETLEQVREDIAQGDPEMMKQQIKDGLEQRDRARKIEPETFWSDFKPKW